jgi:hypothetical protein
MPEDGGAEPYEKRVLLAATFRRPCTCSHPIGGTHKGTSAYQLFKSFMCLYLHQLLCVRTLSDRSTSVPGLR